MNYLPEIIDQIIYFTKNEVYDLLLVNKYFNLNCKAIRILNNDNLPYLTALPYRIYLD